jgi:hypothetical protein
MEDSESMRRMVVDAVNECQDIELLDLIYRILSCDANTGGEKIPAFVLLLTQ